jgi:hypothetical protein
MSNKQLRNVLRVAHLVAGAVVIALVYVESARTSPTFITIAQIIMPVVAISGIAMWQQAALSRLRRRPAVKPDSASAKVG